jgi:ankyrin repeat protein
MLACSLIGVVRGGMQTIEEIESRRKHEVLSLSFYIAQELDRDLSQVVRVLRAGLSSEQTESLDQAHKKALDDFDSQRKEWHTRDAKDFNNDTKYKDDIAEAIDFKVKKIVELGRSVYTATELNADNFVHEAAKKGHDGLITTLVSLGFAVNSKDTDNDFTPLMYASSHGHADTARMLLEKGALSEAVSKNGQTALQLAENYGKDEAAKVLCNHGARGALLYAIKKDLRDMLAELISKGHDLEECHEDGRTPLDLAFIYGNEAAVAVLRSHGAQLTHAAQPRVSLHDAAEKGITEEVFAGIAAGQDINAFDKHGRAAIHYAVRGRHVVVIEALLKAGCNPDIQDQDGATPLILASQNGQVEAARVLIEKGANLELADKKGWRPFDYTVDKGNNEAAAVLRTHCAQHSLHFLAQKGMTDKVAAAVAAGRDINACNSNMETPLMLAVKCDRVETALVLVQMGASREVVDNRGRTAVHYAATREGHVGVVEALLKAGCNPDIQDEDCATPLILASQNGHVKAVRVLIEKGALIEAVDEDGLTALMIASKNCSENGHAEAMRVLIEKGANIEAVNEDGFTALMLASQEGKTKAVKVLIEKGALIEAATKDGFTALIFASCTGRVEAMRLLIEEGGANIEAATKDGVTSLAIVIVNSDNEAVRLLIEKGALIEAATEGGETALMLASRGGNNEVVRLLIEKEANIEASRCDGKTAMQLAEEGDHSEVVALLKEYVAQLSLWYAAAKGMTDELAAGIAAGLDINACNSLGRTPLELALDNDQEEAAAVLRAHGAQLSLFFAAEKGMTDEIAAQIAAGQDVNACNSDGRTPLDLALEKNQEEAAALLRSENAVEGKELKERLHKAWRDAGKVVLIDHVAFGALYEDYTMVFGNFNTFKADMKLSAGKFYYELDIKHIRGLAQFGWATEGFESSTDKSTGEGVGDNAFSWGFDGLRVSKWGDGSSSTFGAAWQEGDVLGLACDMVNKSVAFSVNGSFEPPLGVAFENIAADSIAPAFTANSGFKVVANFGQLPFKHAPPDETYVSVHAAAQK